MRSILNIGLNIGMTFLVSLGAWAADDPCEKILEKGPGALSIVSSGRDGDVIARYKEEFRIASEAAFKLGINVPPHRAELVPSGQLTVLANVGHYPMPHWYDGAKVIKASTAGGVLEFVDPGCPTCRSFYQDTTPPEWQRSILFHVLGHNDVAVLSQFGVVRAPLDPMAFSLQLADVISRLYQEVDHDEVALWIQQMLTVTEMQDYPYGSFDSPQSLVRKPPSAVQQVVARAIERDILGQPIGNRDPYAPQTHPKRPTPSVLQFLVENLPASAPAWKKDVLRLLELTYRAYGSFAQQKILNEGWATFMQWFLPKYTPWRDSKDLVQYGDLLWGVAVPKLDNPYWLGFEGWRCLYRRFLARDNVKALSSDEERDKAFVSYAHGIIAQDSDFDFIFRAFDAQWVFEQKLYLKREAAGDEWDWELPGREPDHNTQAIITSRDPKKVIAWIAKNVADHTRHWARVQMVNENGMGRGVAVYEHQVFEDIPLQFKSAAKAVFVLTQVHEKPVSLKTVASTSWLQKFRPPPDNWWTVVRIMYPGWIPPWFPPPEPELRIFPIRIEVTPEGKVQVFEVKTKAGETEEGETNEGKTEEVIHEELTTKAQDAVTAYKFDLRSSVNDDLAAREEKRFSPQIINQVVDVVIDPALGILHHGPGSAEAVLEYTRMLKARLARAIEKALKGELPVLHGKKSVRIRVLPEIPTFKLDFKVARLLKEKLPPAPPPASIDLQTSMATPMAPMAAKDNSDLGQGDGDIGDHHWDKKDEDGDGDGDDPSDEEPDDFDGPPQDPSYIDIPLDLWAKFLADELELPNMRNLAGKSDEVDTFRVGARKHPKGSILWDRTIPAALFHSIMERLAKGQPPIEDLGRQLVEGNKYLTPDDYIVSSTDTTPLPDLNAVVVFVIDMTGSMNGLPQAIETDMVMNMKLLLQNKYKKVEFRFVGYDDVAHEFSEEEVLKTALGGGNTDSTGYILAKEILDTYPDGRWDKYVMGMGDGGSTDTEATIKAMQDLQAVTRYMAWAQVDMYNWHFTIEFVDAIQKLAKESQWFGFTRLTDRRDVLRAMLELFGKDRQKKE